MNSRRFTWSRIFGVIRYNIFRLHRSVEASVLGRLDAFPTLQSVRGSRLVLESKVRLFKGVSFYLESSSAVVVVGQGTFINRRSEIISTNSVTIGKNCAISWDVLIMDTDNHEILGSKKSDPVLIGDNVWIGSGAVILKGVKVGDGAVIGARSVVTRDVPAESVVAGNPAKVIKENVQWRL